MEMETSSSPDPKTNHEELPQDTPKQKGGLITMPFIIANEAFEKVASYGLLPNMILYLMGDYHMGIASGTNLLFYWSAATNFMPLVGAFLSDSYLGRFLTIGFGSISSFTGMLLLWLTTMIPHAKPSPCNQPCKSQPSFTQHTFLISSFALMSIGAGGIRACSLAFGADQLDKKENPNNESVLESFFSWYYASAAVSVMIALTGIVYIQDQFGWRIGFGVPAILMFLSALLFFVASPLYVKRKATRSLFTGFMRVVVVAYRNRKLGFPNGESGRWHYHKESEFTMPTEKLRFLNKACIIKNPREPTPDPWSLCTVEQVEELKALIKVLPLWSTGIMMSINISQTSFPLLQARSMDRHITPKFQIPAGSFGMFTITALTIWVVIYDRAILPLASKIKGKPVHLSPKLRMGIGLVFSCLGMVVSGIVENVRRKRAIKLGFLDNPKGVTDMSAMWLVPQHSLNGLAEAFNAIGQTEFYYSEFPKTMSSVASAMFGLGMAVANLMASVVVSGVDRYTRGGGGKQSWVSDDINRGRYENYYWLLAIMSAVNFGYFCVCSWAYGPCVGDKGSKDEIVHKKKEELEFNSS